MLVAGLPANLPHPKRSLACTRKKHRLANKSKQQYGLHCRTASESLEENGGDIHAGSARIPKNTGGYSVSNSHQILGPAQASSTI
jgi:hypothetical protein